MELMIGRDYTTQEIIEFFGVSKDKWKRDRNKLLMHLSLYYDYEVKYDKKDARKRIYTILKQNALYEPYKSNGKKYRDNRDKVFEQEIIDVIENDNLQTSANISRLIDKDIKKELNYTSDTIYEYTRLRVNKWFGKGNNTHGTKGMITDKLWCRLDKENNVYIRLSDKQIEFYYTLMYGDEYKKKEKNEQEYFDDYINGIITKEEYKEAVSNNSYFHFMGAREKFKEKYGYYPVKVPVYEIGVFSTVKEGKFDFDTY